MPGETTDAGGLPVNLDRILIYVALISGLGSGYVGVVGTQDRFYGSQGSALEVRVNYLERDIGERFNRHIDTHPDRGLQVQINELREENIRLKAQIEKVTTN